MVGKWERGEKKPSPFYREKLCRLYETSADQLGLLETGVREAATLDRRQVLQLGAGLFLHSATLPFSEHSSIQERVRLSQMLGESIAASWRLFQTASTTSVLAIAQAQLALLEYTQHLLLPDLCTMYYSAIYRLIGAALHFQGRYEEAHLAHEKSYIAALEDNDVWNMAQSLSWQAYGSRASGEYVTTLEIVNAALRLISEKTDTESIRLQARLLAFSAENAALLGKKTEVEARLASSEALLEQLPGHHEEFDRTHWLQQAGVCALYLKQYGTAATRLQQAFDDLPSAWTLRSISTAIPLARALTLLKEPQQALAVAKKVLPIIQAVRASRLTKEFTNYLQTELLVSFPNDNDCCLFVAEAQRQLVSSWS